MQRRRHKFSKILSVLTSDSKSARALTFEILVAGSHARDAGARARAPSAAGHGQKFSKVSAQVLFSFTVTIYTDLREFPDAVGHGHGFRSLCFGHHGRAGTRGRGAPVSRALPPPRVVCICMYTYVYVYIHVRVCACVSVCMRACE